MMGQAKLRGTFEERKAQAMERDNQVKRERAKLVMKHKDGNTLVVGRRNRPLILMAVASALSMPPENLLIANDLAKRTRNR